MQNQAWPLRQAAFQCKKRQKYNLIFCNSIQIPSSDKHLCMILCCLPIQCIGTLFSFHTDQAAFQSFSVTKHLQIDPVYKQFAFRLRKCINNGNGIGVVCRLLFHRKLFHIRRKNQLLRKAQPEGKAPCLKCFFHKNFLFFLCNLPFSTHRVTIPFSAFMIAKKRCSVNCLLPLCNVTCNFFTSFSFLLFLFFLL